MERDESQTTKDSVLQGGPASFRFVEHTGELEMHIRARTLPAIFMEAGRALAELMLDESVSVGSRSSIFLDRRRRSGNEECRPARGANVALTRLMEFRGPVGICLVAATVLTCNTRHQEVSGASVQIASGVPLASSSGDDPPEAQVLRDQLVDELAIRVRSKRVQGAMRRVPRHRFIPGVSLWRAYANIPLPIGHDQTISQPEVVAVMTEALQLRGQERVLEIGTGSGYQAAVLSVLAKQVYTIEIIPELGKAARKRLSDFGYANVSVLIGDGYRGWPKHAPFDRILLTAAPPEVPAALLDELSLGGVLVAPIGPTPVEQRLLRYTKTRTGTTVEDLGFVAFVPMVPANEVPREERDGGL